MIEPRSDPRRSEAFSGVLLLGALVLIVVGGVLTWDATRGRDSGRVDASAGRSTSVTPAAPTTAPPPAAGLADVPGRARRTRSHPPAQRHPFRHPGEPTELRIPTLGVRAPVVPIVAQDRALEPPSDPQVLGWWSPGARPGARRGSALITGHTVHTGGGALDHLGDLRVGALVEARTPRLRMPYVVRRVRVYSKGRLSEDATRLFDQGTEGRLVIITCADWNGSEYLSNVVVTAVPRHGRRYLAQHPERAARLAPSVLAIGHRGRDARGTSRR